MAPARSQVKPRNPAFFRGICAIVRSVRSLVFGLAVACALACSSTAFAFEDRLALGAGAGYAVWPGLNAAHGVALDLHAGYGLSAEWQLRGGVTYALHPHANEDLAFSTLGARAEIVYMVDIFNFVPFGGLGASGIGVFAERDTTLEPAVHLLGGFAYWVSFDWLIQLDVRAHVVPGVIDDSPIYLVSTLSAVLAFDR
jgi:hypothetical protein